MSQILVSKPKKPVLYSEIYFPTKKAAVHSTASEVGCYFCGQQLKEGVSLRAKQVGSRTVFVCKFHD